MITTTVFVKKLRIRIEDDYYCLTDIARIKNQMRTGPVIAHWLSTLPALEFIAWWEGQNNANFNVTEFRDIKNRAHRHGFALSASEWIRKTRAIGIKSTTGIYGGTFADRQIANQFAEWISPRFAVDLAFALHKARLHATC